MDLEQTLAEDQMEAVDDCSLDQEQQQSSDSAVACGPKTTNSSDGGKKDIVFVPATRIKRSQVWQYFGFYKYNAESKTWGN